MKMVGWGMRLGVLGWSWSAPDLAPASAHVVAITQTGSSWVDNSRQLLCIWVLAGVQGCSFDSRTMFWFLSCMHCFSYMMVCQNGVIVSSSPSLELFLQVSSSKFCPAACKRCPRRQQNLILYFSLSNFPGPSNFSNSSQISLGAAYIACGQQHRHTTLETAWVGELFLLRCPSPAWLTQIRNT